MSGLWASVQDPPQDVTVPVVAPAKDAASRVLEQAERVGTAVGQVAQAGLLHGGGDRDDLGALGQAEPGAHREIGGVLVRRGGQQRRHGGPAHAPSGRHDRHNQGILVVQGAEPRLGRPFTAFHGPLPSRLRAPA